MFLFFAALSTVTAVFENILACWMDKWAISGKAVLANLVLHIFPLSPPCLLGNNLVERREGAGHGNHGPGGFPWSRQQPAASGLGGLSLFC